MKTFQLAVLTSLVFTHAVHARVIYGDDNRKEVSEASPLQQKAASAAASMISIDEMKKDASKPGLVTFTQRNLGEWLDEQGGGQVFACEDQRFLEQPNPSMCSGFLIAPDLIVTAGHCAELPTICTEYKWVFGFDVDSKTRKAGVDVKEDNIYGCKKVVSNLLSVPFGLDYAIIQLDRVVKDREPVEIRNEGLVEDFSSLFIVGSPSGLPLKVADGAKVRDNSHPFYFKANLDSFQGNSGSGVFNATTGAAEGILVRGENDYVVNKNKMCIEVNKCADNACRGEDVSRLTSIPEVGIQRMLNKAAEAGDMVVVERLLKLSTWVDFYTKDMETALMKASKAAKTKVIQALLVKGADVNRQDLNGNSPLHHLVKVLNKKTSDALFVLLKAGVNTSLKNMNGETALELARKINPEGAKVLIQNKVN